jgi:hypothetical protein
MSHIQHAVLKIGWVLLDIVSRDFMFHWNNKQFSYLHVFNDRAWNDPNALSVMLLRLPYVHTQESTSGPQSEHLISYCVGNLPEAWNFCI